MLTYMLICFILVMNLIVGQLSSAYKRQVKQRNVLMLMETLSVRAASEADEKYSAAVSPAYPLSILNMLLGTLILSVKSPELNRAILLLYYTPVMLVVFALFVAYQFAILPICYAKIVAHKFALVIKNPGGTGAKSPSNRFGYALFFTAVGPLILLLDCICDIYWFLRHLYKTDLDVLVQHKQEVKQGHTGLSTAINRQTFKKMLAYFEQQQLAETSQQISMQSSVVKDIRSFIGVDVAMKVLMFGDACPEAQQLIAETGANTAGAESKLNGTLSVRSTVENEKLLQPTSVAYTQDRPDLYHLAHEILNEFNIVKQMLINNSLPVAEGKLATSNESIYSRKLIVDKRILYRLLLDLQRYRKLQNLKKSFFIFHRSYDGKPPEMAKWHHKVEIRVS